MCQQEPNYPNFPKSTKRKVLNCKIFESNSLCWFKRESSEMHRNTKASLLRCKVSLSVMWAGILPMSCSLYQCDHKFSTLQLESGRSCASPCSLAENALCSCSTAPRAAGTAPQYSLWAPPAPSTGTQRKGRAVLLSLPFRKGHRAEHPPAWPLGSEEQLRKLFPSPGRHSRNAAWAAPSNLPVKVSCLYVKNLIIDCLDFGSVLLLKSCQKA